MRKNVFLLCLLYFCMSPFLVPTAAIESQAAESSAMQLWRRIGIARYKGSFLCLGDLTGDRRVDFLLYREGPQTTPGFTRISYVGVFVRLTSFLR